MSAVTYLFLESKGDSSDRSLLDSLHQVSGETGNLVSQALGLDDSAVIDDTLVSAEVEG